MRDLATGFFRGGATHVRRRCSEERRSWPHSGPLPGQPKKTDRGEPGGFAAHLWRLPLGEIQRGFAALRAAVPTGGRRSKRSPRFSADWHCALSLGFAQRCLPEAVKMQPRREPQQSRWRRWQGNADLRPVLPVGAGTAARSAAKGVYHAAARMTLNAEVPAERRTTPALRVLLCRPEVGVPSRLRDFTRGGVLLSAQKQWQRTLFAAGVTGGKV